MNASRWTLKVTGFMLALVVAVLAANPAAAEQNNGPSYRDRIDAAREGCKKSGGTFTMTIEASQGRAHTKCAEKDGTSTNCTITMSHSVCENKPAESATGPGWARPIGDISIVEVEITQAGGQWATSGDALPAVEQSPTIVEIDDAGSSSLTMVENDPEPSAPVDEVPLDVEEIEDEEA